MSPIRSALRVHQTTIRDSNGNANHGDRAPFPQLEGKNCRGLLVMVPESKQPIRRNNHASTRNNSVVNKCPTDAALIIGGYFNGP